MFELKLPVDTLQMKGPLFAAGTVWLSLASTDFPETGWHDTPLSVFGSLHTAVQEALKGHTHDAHFFEGPYLVKITPVAATPESPRLIQITGINDRDDTNPAVLADITAPLREVVENLNSTLRSLRAWAANAGNADIQATLLAIPDLPEPMAPSVTAP
ncbi:hypothetical protein [Streptomyces flaveolus]|uniref:hypothetical protein n=1 Tax=Streptomyces flaveolus TaxID=67297 RepID=UPI00333063DA